MQVQLLVRLPMPIQFRLFGTVLQLLAPLTQRPQWVHWVRLFSPLHPPRLVHQASNLLASLPRKLKNDGAGKGDWQSLWWVCCRRNPPGQIDVGANIATQSGAVWVGVAQE